MPDPAVSVVVPTRNRAEYLRVTLASLAAQAPGVPHETIVVDDGSTDATADVAVRGGALYLRHERSLGPNAARNTGIEAARGSLIAFVDDDVRMPRHWVGALAAGAVRHKWAEAFGGPIRASLEGPAPRTCGRESPPITTLDLGERDRETDFVWSANMAARRGAFERVGRFDADVPIYGDEEEWLMRLHAAGGRVAYVAAAGLEHRRAGADARLRALAHAEYRRGRAARANDRRKRTEPALPRELRDLAGASWHTLRRGCPRGLTMCAHSTGRLVEALRPR